MISSTDLKRWTRYEGSPIVGNGDADSMDGRVAGDPCVVRYGDQWAIFYYCFDEKGVSRNCLAFSPDLKKTVKCEGCLIAPGLEGSIDASYSFKPSVIWHEGVLYHFYTAVSEKINSNGISVATSKPVG